MAHPLHGLPALSVTVAALTACLGLSAATATPPGARHPVPATAFRSALNPASGPARGKHLVSPRPPGTHNTINTYTSVNWDGYFATTPNKASDFTQVSAAWVQPPVTCTSKNAWVVFWVGFDGWWNGHVEQGGTEAHCVHGTAFYNTWWEMYPYNSIRTKFAIQPGDQIQANVTYTPSTKMFAIVVADVTSGQTLTVNTLCHADQYGCTRTSAEVMSEDVGGGSDVDHLFYLPDYGTQTFSSATVTDINGHTGTLSDSAWDLGMVDEVNSNALQKQSTSALTSAGDGFSTQWLHQ